MPYNLDAFSSERIRQGNAQETADAIDQIAAAVREALSRLDGVVGQSALTPLYCRVYRSSTQTIPSGVETTLQWDTPPVAGSLAAGQDVGGLFSAPDTILLPEPGVYVIEARCQWDTNATGERRFALAIPGAVALDAVQQLASEATSVGLIQRVSAVVEWRNLDAGTALVVVVQDSGGDRTVGGNDAASHWFSVTRVAGVR